MKVKNKPWHSLNYTPIGSIENGYVETAANRLYYAAYYAVSALLISYKYEASTHNGVIQMFGKVFLRNNIIDKKYGKTFNQLFSLRLTGDYEDRHILDLETEVLPLVEPAKELIDLVSEMAKKQLMWLQNRPSVVRWATRITDATTEGCLGSFIGSDVLVFPSDLFHKIPLYVHCYKSSNPSFIFLLLFYYKYDKAFDNSRKQSFHLHTME